MCLSRQFTNDKGVEQFTRTCALRSECPNQYKNNRYQNFKKNVDGSAWWCQKATCSKLKEATIVLKPTCENNSTCTFPKCKQNSINSKI